jgi:hypothetical protein
MQQDERTKLKAELNSIRSTVDKSNVYMNSVIDELANPAEDRLRTYFNTVLKNNELTLIERQYYERLLKHL